MSAYLVAIGLVFALMALGLAVDRLYRAFAAKHPQLGPFRKADGCGCCSGQCAGDDSSCSR